MTRPTPALVQAVALAAAVLVAASPASGAGRWEPAAGGASVILPEPAKASGIVGGSLFCVEQRWAFLLRIDREAPDGAAAHLKIGVDESAGTVEPGHGTLTMGVPAGILAQLKDGNAMTVTVGAGRDALSARFPLAGSRAAIEAAAPLCSAPDVAGFEAVALQSSGVALDAAQPLMQDELSRFQAATSGAVPVLSAAFLDGEGSRNLLFASLCGSHRYYGETGCKLMGFAAEAGSAWRPVYDTQGMSLFRDPRVAHGGWPDLVTLATTGEIRRLRWTWGGQAYQAADDAAVAGDLPPPVDKLRTGATGGD